MGDRMTSHRATELLAELLSEYTTGEIIHVENDFMSGRFVIEDVSLELLPDGSGEISVSMYDETEDVGGIAKLKIQMQE